MDRRYVIGLRKLRMVVFPNILEKAGVGKLHGGTMRVLLSKALTDIKFIGDAFPVPLRDASIDELTEAFSDKTIDEEEYVTDVQAWVSEAGTRLQDWTESVRGTFCLSQAMSRSKRQVVDKDDDSFDPHEQRIELLVELFEIEPGSLKALEPSQLMIIGQSIEWLLKLNPESLTDAWFDKFHALWVQDVDIAQNFVEAEALKQEEAAIQARVKDIEAKQKALESKRAAAMKIILDKQEKIHGA